MELQLQTMVESGRKVIKYSGFLDIATPLVMVIHSNTQNVFTGNTREDILAI
jgi:hypothetical protein